MLLIQISHPYLVLLSANHGRNDLPDDYDGKNRNHTMQKDIEKHIFPS
jgi:hypothetical protein